jgi:hypothetical protein
MSINCSLFYFAIADHKIKIKNLLDKPKSTQNGHCIFDFILLRST